MQVNLRQIGAKAMTAADHQFFVDTYTEGKLVKPEDSGYVIAALSVQAPKHLNGEFVAWNSEECRDYQRQ